VLNVNATAVIVGAGHAGFTTAAALRDGGYAGPIMLISEEPDLPYQRPPLSKSYLLNQLDRARIAFRPESFYRRKEIELRRGEAVTRIDRAARRVYLRSGTALDYGVVVLATGAAARQLSIPGQNLSGVHQLRNTADCDELRRVLGGAAHPVVIGGGFIGLEFAAVAAALGKPSVILEAATRLLSRSVSAVTAQALSNAHQRWGNSVMTGAAVTRIVDNGSGAAAGVELASGALIDADLVIVGVGAVPRTGLADSTGLATADGVLVDRYLRTSDPDIFAVGDCARFPAGDDARDCRRESVQNATDQGRAVAKTICGTVTPYTALPWFWTDQGPIRLQIAGEATGHDSAITVTGVKPGSSSTFCFVGDRLVAVESIDHPTDHVAARKVLADPATAPRQPMISAGFDLAEFARGRGNASVSARA
jgi:3-phenylpropionate/trans-cinnamate dioxygenase ferredoxin reductase subunit